MDERYRGQQNDEIEELEIAEAEGASLGRAELEPEIEPEPQKFRASSPLLAFQGVRDLARSGDRSSTPLCLLDASLRFVYRNPAFLRLVQAFGYPESPSFLGTFTRCVDATVARQCREALTRPDLGWTWQGDLVHKTRDSAAIVTKAIISPIWLSDDSANPDTFALYLHDVTEEHRHYLRKAFESLLKASLKKDNDTGAHIERVNRYSRHLSEALRGDPRWPEVGPDFVEDIGFLAAMHDVGKIGTPDDILNKNGPLTETEWRIMKEHTINGAFILDGYPNPMGRQIALSHHEWWNGAGYPFNLEEGMIPLAARIVTIADVYDALRMKRSYKPPYAHEVAVEKIVAERGTHFDPGIVDVFYGIAADFERIYAENAD